MKQMILKEMHDPYINETIYHEQLENGLPVYILPKKGFQQKYAIFATDYGSVINRFRAPGEKEITTVPDGIAHFLEHKMFDAPEANVFDLFAQLGANVNAFTTYTLTGYLFDTVDHFDDCLEILLDFVQSIYLTDESVEKEKGIIEQEIRMYEDDPDWVTYLNLLQALFHTHPVQVDIAGSVESIYRINREMLLKCYQTFYHPSNMALFIQGDLDPVTTMENIRQNQRKKGFQARPPIETNFGNEPKTVDKQQMIDYISVSRPIYQLGFKDRRTGESGDVLHKKDLVTSILVDILFGKGSKLYQELYEAGLIDDSFSVSVTLERDHGMTVLGGHTMVPDKLHQAILRGIDERKSQIKQEELNRIRKRLMGDYILSFDSQKATAHNFIAYHFKGMNIFHELELLKSITLDDLHERLEEHFDLAAHAVSIMYPEKEMK